MSTDTGIPGLGGPPPVPVDLEAVRALCDAATPEPWRLAWNGQELRLESPAETDEIASWTYAIRTWVDEDRAECDTADAAFIVAARTLVPQMRAEIERLRAELDVSDGIRDLAWEWIACGDAAAGELLNAAVLKHGASDIPARGEVR